MGLFTKAELAKKNKAELDQLIEDHSIEIDEDATVADKRAALLDLEAPEVEEEEDDEELDDPTDEEEEEDDLELPEEDEVDEAPPVKAAAKKTTTAKAKQTKYSDGEGILGAKEVATKVGTDAKSLRQFFRSGKSTFEAVGAGGRYEFKAEDVDKIKAEFDAWKAGKPGRGASTGSTPRKRGSKAAAVAEVIEEVEEIEELEDLEELDEDDLELED